MADHDDEEELLEIEFFSSFTTTKKKSKEITNSKKEKYMGSQSSSCERTSFDLSLKLGDCLLYRGIFSYSLCQFFFKFSRHFFAFLERDWTLLKEAP